MSFPFPLAALAPRRLSFLSFGLLVLVAACGDRVVGTMHASPGLTPLDAADASASSPAPAAADAGAIDEAAAPPDDAGGDGSPAPPSCTAKTGAAGDLTLSLTSGGYARTSLLHVPASYDPTRGAMLVLNFHGFTSNDVEQEALTGMNAVADQRGLIVAYPQGIGDGWNAGDCCTETQPAGVDDVQFTRDLLALVESRYCIDPARIYATGFSNGGFLSHRLACEMSTTFAAVAPVSGVLGIPRADCNPARPVPVIDFHGTADPVVPYDGGPAAKLLPPIVFRSVDETVEHWRSVDACLGAPTVTYAHGDATCVRWSDCDGGADVELCTMVGDGHQWPDGIAVPGLGPMSTDIDATGRMIDFFVAHPMR